MKLVRAAAIVVAAAAALGCQKSRDEATEAVVEHIIASKGRESRVEIDRDHGEIRVTLGGAVKPAGWPSAVPVYPHAERAKVEKPEKPENGEAGGARRLTVTTADSIADLRSFYRDALANDGWALAEDERVSPWTARRGSEKLRIRFVARDHGKGSRAEIEYRERS